MKITIDFNLIKFTSFTSVSDIYNFFLRFLASKIQICADLWITHKFECKNPTTRLVFPYEEL